MLIAKPWASWRTLNRRRGRG